ncbi:hypothetical protein [Aestuariivita boseongensis]|uniref:hypothetical protein n=1 Tax=Aestuariivita boseongensis TaxID=1470562 RepID=UPI000680458D|nr:hypothetical protein [Aestuariivita boseongensis]
METACLLAFIAIPIAYKWGEKLGEKYGREMGARNISSVLESLASGGGGYGPEFIDEWLEGQPRFLKELAESLRDEKQQKP